MEKQHDPRVTRRQVLKGAAQAGVLGSLVPVTLQAKDPARNKNVIVRENEHAGTTDWQLTYVRSKDFRSDMLEGYCSRTSARRGESIDVFVSADQNTEVTIDLYRMGYYGGKGGRQIARLGPFPASPQPTPPVAKHRLRECQWRRTATIVVQEDWTSGVYLGKLSCSHHRYQSY